MAIEKKRQILYDYANGEVDGGVEFIRKRFEFYDIFNNILKTLSALNVPQFISSMGQIKSSHS